MAKSLTKDTFRDIKKSFGRFFSILMICALGVAFFVGIKSAPLSMEKTVDQYYDDYHMMDLRLVSTLGFTEDDVEALRKLDGIEGIFPTYSQDVLTTYHNRELVLKLHALPKDLSDENKNYLNRVKVIEGRLPQKSGEVVIEQGAYMDQIKIGSKLTLESGTDTPLSDQLHTVEYTVVGIVQTPYYLSFDKGSSTIGSGQISSFVMIPQEDFKSEIYTEIFLTAEGVRDLDTFSQKYQEALNPLVSSIEEVAHQRTQVRYDEVVQAATEELNKGKEEYDAQRKKVEGELQQAAAQLEEAQQTITSGKNELTQQESAFQTTINQAKQQLNQAETELTDQQKVFDEKYQQFYAIKASSWEQIELAKQEMNQATTKVSQLAEAIDGLKELLNGPLLSEEEKVATKEELTKLEAQYQQANEQLQTGREELAKKEQELIDGEQQLIEAKQGLIQAKEALNQQKTQLDFQIKTAQEKFDEARRQLQQGEIEYNEGKQQYEEGKKEAEEEFKKVEEQLAKAQEQIDEISHPKWLILDRNKHYSFVDYQGASDSINAISQVFPVFFFMVAALVCLTTMTRMVDEQRMNIGTLKALGYGKYQIASKFLIYAGLASMIGSILGVAVGNLVFPSVVVNAYSMMYILPQPIIVFSWPLILLAVVIAVSVTTLSAYFALSAELVETPSLLMRPKAPKEGKRILLERIPFIWNRLSFIAKVTVRNIFRYKKRFFMTVFGIAGCTALLLTGFGLKDSIRTIVDKQFNTLFLYDMTISFDRMVTNTDRHMFKDALSHEETFGATLLTTTENGKVMANDEQKELTLFIPDDLESLGDVIHFQNRLTNEELQLTDQGAILTEKAAKQLKVKVGDQVTVENSKGEQAQVSIVGITENYISHYIYLSKALYQKLFGREVEPNQLLVSSDLSDSKTKSQVASELMARDEISGVSFVSALKDNFDDMLTNLNYVIILLIISAGALAFVVLYNLTNVNISERMREIATIKVLGFYDQEVSAYIYRENIILTLIGTLVGLGLGVLLHLFVMTTVEVDMMMFGRQIAGTSYLYAAGLTILFAVIVNFAMYYKLKNVEMVESLKSVD